MLSSILAMRDLAQERHGHRPLSNVQIDAAAAAELRYHHARGRTFTRPQAALYQALLRLVVERPERLFRT